MTIEARKFSDFPLYNNEHYKEPREFNSKSDIMVRFLSSRLKEDIKRRVWDKELKKYDRDIKDLSDDERKSVKDEIKRVVSNHFKLIDKGEK